MNSQVMEDSVDLAIREMHLFKTFMEGVISHFSNDPSLNMIRNPIIHTIKHRIKDPDHIREKISRKWCDNDPINVDNIFQRITDIAGVRILHLYRDQFPDIHRFIAKRVEDRDWFFVEDPIAYSWDPESKFFFEKLGLRVDIKDSYYTSIHYLIKPKEISHVCCEIQVRTLFEEIWGEIDHSLNYPVCTNSFACGEQIKVLSKLVATGSRLADSIFRTASIQ
ncbi:MAG: RelA/SpoT domain-containing protein [Magnetococcus sp. YQC-3]